VDGWAYIISHTPTPYLNDFKVYYGRSSCNANNDPKARRTQMLLKNFNDVQNYTNFTMVASSHTFLKKL
jgi:hypothetical protein